VEEAVRQEIILLAYEMLVTDFNGKAGSLRLESWLSLPASLTISLLSPKSESNDRKTSGRLLGQTNQDSMIQLYFGGAFVLYGHGA